MRRSVRRSTRRVSRNTRRSTRRRSTRRSTRRSARRSTRRSARRNTRRRSTKRRSTRRSTKRRSTRRSTRRRRHHMKGGGLYGTPASPASIAIPVGAAVVASAAVAGISAANYKRLPQNVRDRCNEAIKVIEDAHKKQKGDLYGNRPNFVEGLLNEQRELLQGEGVKTVIDQIIEKLKGYERTNTTPDQGEKTPPIILSRHFDTVLMERANLLEPDSELKEILESMVGQESPFQTRLILRKGLRTTESLMGRSHRTGLQDAEKLAAARGKGGPYIPAGTAPRPVLGPQRLPEGNWKSHFARAKKPTVDPRYAAGAVGSVPGLSSSLEADAKSARDEAREEEEHAARSLKASFGGAGFAEKKGSVRKKPSVLPKSFQHDTTYNPSITPSPEGAAVGGAGGDLSGLGIEDTQEEIDVMQGYGGIASFS